METLECADDILEVNHLEPNGIIPKNNQSCAAKLRHSLRQNLLMVLTLLSIGLGFALGFAVRELRPSEDAIMWIGMPGALYLRVLKLTIMPLVVCSVITGAASLNPQTNGRIGTYVFVLVMITHIIGCSISTGLMLLINPGTDTQTARTKNLGKAVKTHDIFADLLRNIFPDNIVEATFRQTVTKYVKTDTLNNFDSNSNDQNQTTMTDNSSVPNVADVLKFSGDFTRVVSHTSGINVLGLITIGIIFGIAAGKLRHQVRVFIMFVDNVLQLVLMVVRWFLWLTPIGVLSLIASSISKVDDVTKTFSDLGFFVLAFLLAIVVHWTIVLPTFYVIFLRRNPLTFFVAHFPALSIAFAAANAIVALPEMFRISEEKFHMDKRLSRIALPLTLTLNADGSGIFIVSASLFLTDYAGVTITAGITMVIMSLAVVSALAIPPVPSSSILVIIIILTAVHVPVQNVVILFAVEWFLDRVRTACNIASHLTIVTIVHSLCKKSLRSSNTDSEVPS